MISYIKRHPYAVGLALALHLLIALFLIGNFWSKPIVVSVQDAGQALIQPEVSPQMPLTTMTVDQELIEAQLTRIREQESQRQAEQQRQLAEAREREQRITQLQRQQEEETRKAEQARRQADQERQRIEAERQRAEVEQRRAEEARRVAAQAEQQRAQAERDRARAEQQAREAAQQAERQRQTEERRLAELAELQKQAEAERAKQEARQRELAEQTRQQEAERARLAALAEEEARQREAARQREVRNLRQSYVSSITAKVRENWRTPADISAEAQCELVIVQERDGTVVSVKTDRCNGQASEQFKQAAERAVLRASPLPQAPVPDVYERTIRFVFKP